MRVEIISHSIKSTQCGKLGTLSYMTLKIYFCFLSIFSLWIKKKNSLFDTGFFFFLNTNSLSYTKIVFYWGLPCYTVRSDNLVSSVVIKYHNALTICSFSSSLHLKSQYETTGYVSLTKYYLWAVQSRPQPKGRKTYAW